jgi:hypothetical protein
MQICARTRARGIPRYAGCRSRRRTRPQQARSRPASASAPTPRTTAIGHAPARSVMQAGTTWQRCDWNAPSTSARAEQRWLCHRHRRQRTENRPASSTTSHGHAASAAAADCGPPASLGVGELTLDLLEPSPALPFLVVDKVLQHLGANGGVVERATESLGVALDPGPAVIQRGPF